MTDNRPAFDTLIRTAVRDQIRLDRRRDRIRHTITILTMIACAALLIAGGATVRSTVDRIGARSACQSAARTLSDSYQSAMDAHERATEAFATLDPTLDLDALSRLMEETPTPPETVDCVTNPDVPDDAAYVDYTRRVDELLGE